MSYRIFMTIRRGMTDATAVCVFPWERPLLEEIHGAGATEVSIEEMCSIKGASKVATIKLPVAAKNKRKVNPGAGLREQLEAMAVVDPEADPAEDLDAEYGRLVDKYGMHKDVALPVVEKVYGSPTLFKQAVRPFLGKKPVDDEIEPKGAAARTPRGETVEKPLAEQSKTELQALLKKHKIGFGKTAGIDELRDLAETALA